MDEDHNLYSSSNIIRDQIKEDETDEHVARMGEMRSE
jgi:hypothetical protein